MSVISNSLFKWIGKFEFKNTLLNYNCVTNKLMKIFVLMNWINLYIEVGKTLV